MDLIKSFLTGVLYDYFNLIFVFLNEEDKAQECCSCFKLIMQAHLHVVFSTISFVKYVHAFFITNTFISNTALKLAKNQAKAKQHPQAELFAI